MPSSFESRDGDRPLDSARGRPRATVLGAFLEGWRRVLRAPALTASIFGLTLLLALPLALALRAMLNEHLGASLEADRAAAGWNASWAAEFGAQAQGLGRTFTHEILGFGGTLANLSGLLDARRLNPAITGAIAVYLVAWVFLSGGLLDRLARARPVGTAAFFSACGVYFIRFLRLGIIIGAAYWFLFRWVQPTLFGDVYASATRDMTTERQGLLLRAGLYLVFAAALAAVNVVADFAKVRAVVEDRHSMIGALAASMRFIRRRPLRVAALYLVNILALLIILRLWLQVAPTSTTAAWWALFISQIYLLARVWARLAFIASEIVFFQGELAHADYTALPEPVWPDSPAAEAVERTSSRS